MTDNRQPESPPAQPGDVNHQEVDPDLTAGMRPASAWRGAGVLAVLVASLAAFYPEGVVNVVQSLPEHPATDPLIPAAYVWQDWMSAAGVVDAYDAVRNAFNFLRGR